MNSMLGFQKYDSGKLPNTYLLHKRPKLQILVDRCLNSESGNNYRIVDSISIFALGRRFVLVL